MTQRRSRLARPIVSIIFLVCLGLGLAGGHQATAAPPLEFCHDRAPDRQLDAAQSRERQGRPSRTDCTPLAERTTPSTSANSDDLTPRRPTRPLTLDNLQQEVSAFLQEYRRFLGCCQTDPAELQSLEALGEYVDDLLQAAQQGLFSEQMKLRGMTIREMLAPVGAARRELRLLHAHLRELGILIEQEEVAGGKDSPAEPGRMAATEEALLHPSSPSLPSGAKTGVEIGVTPSTGRNIGKTPQSGPSIGTEGLTGLDIGATPKTGREIGATGPTGFEVGATGRAGPGIGESPFNSDASSSAASSLQPSTIGSSLGDSTVGSTISSSTVGSSLSDSTIGSSFGGSSVGSSLQNRGTRP